MSLRLNFKAIFLICMMMSASCWMNSVDNFDREPSLYKSFEVHNNDEALATDTIIDIFKMNHLTLRLANDDRVLKRYIHYNRNVQIEVIYHRGKSNSISLGIYEAKRLSEQNRLPREKAYFESVLQEIEASPVFSPSPHAGLP